MATTVYKALQEAAKGLIYSSESDRPVKAIHFTAAEEITTPLAAVAAAASVDPSEVEVVSVEDFLSPMTTEQKWATDEDKEVIAQFKALQTVLLSLEGAAAHRIGEGPDIDVYVIGKAPDGSFMGVKTRVTET